MPERLPPTAASELRLVAGNLALEFVNTVDMRDGPSPVDHLVTTDDLTRWALQADLLDDGEARTVRRSAKSDAARAERQLREARATREVIYRTFAAVTRSAEPDAADLRELSRRYQKALASFALHAEDGEVAWIWRPESDGIERILAAVVRSAVELLTSQRLVRVKECAAAKGECGWLFLDSTRSGTRRWCEMSVCGSRAKSRRHYARHAGQAARGDAS